MNDDIKALSLMKMKGEEWDSLAQEDPEVMRALHYLILLETHGGIDAAGQSKTSAEVSQLLADDLGISVQTLAIRRRKWMQPINNGPSALDKANEFLLPLRKERDMRLAYAAMDIQQQLVMGVIQEALKTDAGFYKKRDAWLFLQKYVIEPVTSKTRDNSGQAETDYLETLKQSSEEDDYINSHKG